MVAGSLRVAGATSHELLVLGAMGNNHKFDITVFVASIVTVFATLLVLGQDRTG